MADSGVLMGLAHLIGYIWDRLSFVPWYILSNAGRRLSMAYRQKSVPLDGTVDGPWRSGDAENMVDSYYAKKTMPEIFDDACKKFTNDPCMGTRELLSEEDEKQPNGKVFKKAIYGEYQWQTYGEIHSKVKKFAAGLSELGVERVAIYMETRADWIIAAQACWRHNITIVTVYATLGEQAVADALTEAKIEWIISSSALVEAKLAGVFSKGVNLKGIIHASHENTAQKLRFKIPDNTQTRVYSYDDVYKLGNDSLKAPPPLPKPETISLVMYTSGTSGKAKGVLISQANMVAAISGIGERIQTMVRFTTADTYIAFLPLAHILELMAENCMFANGARVGYSSALTLSDRSSRIKKGSQGDASVLKPTLMASVPEILERIRKGVMANVEQMKPMQKWLFNFAYEYKSKQTAMGRDTPILNALIFKKTAQLLGGNMRAMLSGGAPLEEKTQRFMEVCIKTPLVIGYGLTETTGGVAVNDITEFRVGRTGGVLDSCYVKLVEWKEGGYSPFNKPYPQGEIWCGGNMVTHGYYEMPEKTAEDFHTDEKGIRWFKTGDIGQFDEDGSLRIIDRKKDLVKLRHGEYIALGKIEAALKTSPLLTNLGIFVDSNELSCVAVAVGNEEQLTKIATANGITGDFSEWANSKVIVDEVKKSMMEAAKASGLSKQEMPSNVYVETLQWLPETGLVTDAFKIKRKTLNEKYDVVVKKLYKK